MKKFVPLVDIPYIRYESHLFSKVRYKCIEVSPERLLFIGSPYSKDIVFLGVSTKIYRNELTETRIANLRIRIFLRRIIRFLIIKVRKSNSLSAEILNYL